MKIILENYKCPSWNQIAGRGHWSKRADMATEGHEEVSIALLKLDWQPFTTPVRIVVNAYLKRPIDHDNVCEKFIVDGLRLCEVIKDDSPKYVSSIQTNSIPSKTDYTVIEIYDR